MMSDGFGWGLGGGGRNRTGVDGFAGRCMTTLPPRPRGGIIRTVGVIYKMRQIIGWW